MYYNAILSPLVDGEKLSREEFLRRWDALPLLKRAELIEAVVYLPGPVTVIHASQHGLAHLWIAHYAVHTPGCESLLNPTWFLLDDAPQPDGCLRILPEYGGRSGLEGEYCAGPPELIVEVCYSSTAYDLGPKLRLYRKAGVQEYVTVQIKERQVIWRRWVAGDYTNVEPDSRGLLRSVIFPGLWLDPAALLDRNGQRILQVLNEGLASPEHAEFVQQLHARRQVG